MQEATTSTKPRNDEASPFDRWMSLGAAAALVAYGLSRRSPTGACLAASGMPLVYRACVGRWPSVANGHAQDTRAALTGERGIDVRESIRIEKPVGELYRLWRDFEALPRFMPSLERVTEVGNGQSHWVAKGPIGRSIEWNAEIISDFENHLISWRSLPGSDITTAGSVKFSPVRAGHGTQLSVHFQYAAPAGAAGATVARLLGQEPSRTIREDLRRLKQLLEAGEIPRTTAGD